MTALENAPLAYSYVRMSTTDQLKGDSLRRQVEAGRKYAEENGLKLVDDFKLHDIGVSAFKGSNATKGALSVFLAAIQAGKIPQGSYLLVESLDRLSREKIRLAMQLLWDITKAGINVVTLSDRQVYKAGQDDLQSLIYSIVVMSRANEESHLKSLRIAAAWDKKRENVATRKLTKVAPAWLRLSTDGASFHVDEDKAAVVRRIFDLALAGMGPHSIVRMLNAENCVPFGRSHGWHMSYIDKILKSRAVFGEFQPRHSLDGVRRPVGEPIAAYYPAVVTEDQFHLVQVARRARSTYKGGRKGSTFQNLFTHLTTCAYCGAKMRMVNKGNGPKGGRYLKCSNAVRKLECDVVEGWRYDHFERAFFTFAQEVDLTALLRPQTSHDEVEAAEKVVVAAEERLRILTTRRQRTFELIDDTNLATDFLRDRLEQVEGEIAVEKRAILSAKEVLAGLSVLSARPASELSESIDRLQSVSGHEAFELRSRLADRLAAVTTEIKLAVRGREVFRARTARFLAENEPDEHFRAQLISHIEKVDREAGADGPTFTARFAGGVTRIVVVDFNDPTRFVLNAEFDGDNANIVNAKNGWSKSISLPPPP